MTALIAKPMGQLLFLIYQLVDNYGITLVIFTIIVRALLFPLYADQMKHSSKLQEVQPKMQELQKKYANDKETLNIKMMELYKEEKVNPARGCLPMLIQFPIIIGLFALLRNPTTYITDPSMLQAVHESFLWVMDLSQPDLWVLPIAAGVATYFSFVLNSSSAIDNPTANNPTMKMMKYFFPVMIVWWGRSFPAGLTIYWFVGTLIQVFQTIGLKKYNKMKAAKKQANA